MSLSSRPHRGLSSSEISLNLLQNVWLQQIILRFGLIVAGLILMGSIDALRQTETVDFTLPIFIELAEYGLFFAMLLLASRRRLAPRLGLLVPLALMLVLMNRVIYAAVMQAKGGGIWAADIYTYNDYAAFLFRNGANPYSYDMADSFRVLRAWQIYITPLLRNDLHGTLAYPPLSFLVLIPFQLLGIPSNYTYILCLVLCCYVIYRATPPTIRPIILIPFFCVADFMTFSFDGVSESVWVLLLLLMIVDWKHEKRRALWFGLVCSYKQQPWLVAPFLLIRIWHDFDGYPFLRRIQALITFTGISALVFFVINAPFMATDFGSWLTGIMDNFRDGIIVVGVGLSRLTEMGLVTISKSEYSLLMLLVLGVSLLLYWRHHERWRDAMWMLPGLAFWFGYRGLTHYWAFWVFPLVLSLARSTVFTLEDERKTPSRLQMRLSAALVAGTALFIGGALVFFSLRANPISISLDGPIYATGDYVNQLNLIVTNNSNKTLTPRFSVLSRYLNQPYFWNIVKGPEAVPPGTNAHYTIQATWPAIDFYYRPDFTSSWPFYDFFYRDGALIIVTDALRYDLRAATKAPTDFATAYPGVIPNGNFVYWRQDQHAPNYWSTVTDPPNDNAIQRVDDPDHGYDLRFMMPDATRADWSTIKLDTEMFFPETPIQMWVKPPTGANLLPDVNIAYGLELSALDKRVWVLFGDEASHGKLDADTYYWMIPAPRNVWSQQTINVRQIFTTLGIEIRDMEQQDVWRFEQYNYPKTRLYFRLLLAARNQPPGWVSADFGPLNNTSLLPDRNTLAQMAIQNPERMLIWRGEENRSSSNLALAEDYFNRALKLAPNEARAYIGLGWTYYDMDKAAQAMQAFEQGRQLVSTQMQRYDNHDLGETYYGQGYVYLLENQCAQAAAAFQTAQTYASDYKLPTNYGEICEPGAEATAPPGP